MIYITGDTHGELTGFFDYMMYEVDFKQWFFGHWHTDENFNFNLHGKQKNFNAIYFNTTTVDNQTNV